MSADFSDARNSLSFNSQEDTDGNIFTMSDIDPFDATTRADIEYSNSFRINSSATNKPVISVARRNERERKRVRLVNQGFAILRDRVPRDRCSRGRRSSKVETLRAAIMYIRQLQQLLLENQMRYQDQDMAQCYSYVGDDSYLNTPVTSIHESYAINHRYPHDLVDSSTYPHLRASVNIQHANQMCDHHLAVPWFT